VELKSTLIIPVGTQVVTLVDKKGRAGGHNCPTGNVGVVIAAPQDNSHSYHVRLLDGTEISLRRTEFAIRKHHQAGELTGRASAMEDFDLTKSVIFVCITGSRAYGLERESSDIDRRGIYLAPAALQWSLYGVPEQLEDKSTDECYWELQKFLVLALKANPNVLECLYSPLIEKATPIAEELLSMRDAFLSKLVYQTYNGYVMSQFKKLEQDLRNRGEVKWKHSMHLIRLLLEGISVLREGSLHLRMEQHRSKLLAIRDGELTWTSIDEWRLRLHREFEQAYGETKLPDRPNYERANAFLIGTRRASAFNEEGFERC
jgi:predicted nucleotidyltransferase